MENWKLTIWSDNYEVSDLGRVRNVTTQHVLTPVKETAGYFRIKINGKHKKIHRLVCESFLGPQEGKEVNHINGVKTDNRLENLEWVTRSENLKHAYDINLRQPITKEQTYCHRVPKEEHPCYGRTGDKHPMYGRLGSDHHNSKKITLVELGIEFGSYNEATRWLKENYQVGSTGSAFSQMFSKNKNKLYGFTWTNS